MYLVSYEPVEPVISSGTVLLCSSEHILEQHTEMSNFCAGNLCEKVLIHLVDIFMHLLYHGDSP